MRRPQSPISGWGAFRSISLGLVGHARRPALAGRRDDPGVMSPSDAAYALLVLPLRVNPYVRRVSEEVNDPNGGSRGA